MLLHYFFLFVFFFSGIRTTTIPVVLTAEALRPAASLVPQAGIGAIQPLSVLPQPGPWPSSSAGPLCAC